MLRTSGKRKLFLGSSLLCAISFLALILSWSSHPAAAQQPKASGGDVERGKYIVNNVAMCPTCHTPRLANGELDHSRWLAGAPEPYQPSQPMPDWPITAPRLAGRPPTTDEGMIMLLMTAVWIDGKPLRDPMPKFHMTRADAEAVLAYLKSL